MHSRVLVRPGAPISSGKATSKVALAVAVSLASSLAAANNLTIEEITVTAQKREQSINDVGIAIAAFSGDQLDAMGVSQSTDLAKYIPGVNLSGSFAGQMPIFAIRGVVQNDVLDHTEPPTAVYLDEGYLPSIHSQGLVLFDMERVEVLKGPQGTLFGRNATGGAVSNTSRKPTEETGGFVSLDISKSQGRRLEAAVGGSLTDNVQGRVALLSDSNDGFYDNQFPGGADLGGQDTWGLRTHLQFQPSETVDVLLSAFKGRQEMSTGPYQAVPTTPITNGLGQLVDAVHLGNTTGLGTIDADGSGFDLSHDLSSEDANWMELQGGTARVEWQLGEIALTSVTDYKHFEKEFYLDVDATEVPFLNTINYAEVENYSQEFRAFAEYDAYRWTAGVYYLNIATDVPLQAIDVPALGIAGGDIHQFETDSSAVFIQLEHDVSDKLTLNGGVRFTREEKNFEYESFTFASTGNSFNGVGAALGPALNRYEGDSSDNLVSGRLGMDYRYDENTLLYASFNRGIKAGGFNAPFGGQFSALNVEAMADGTANDRNLPYDEEVLNAFETGVKATMAEGAVHVNASAFYYDYSDYQAFRLIGLTTQVVNNDASVWGVELDITAKPAENWWLYASVGYLHTEVEDVDLGNGLIVDRETAYSPELTAAFIARRDFQTHLGTLSLQLEATYTGEQYYALTNYSSSEMDGYWLGNVRVIFDAGEHWQLNAFVENVSDVTYETVGFDLPDPAFGSLSETGYGQPRWWGMNIKYQY